MPRELGHFFVAHVAHLDRRRFVAIVAPMAVVAAEAFAVSAMIANKNVCLNMRAKHFDLPVRLRKLRRFCACVNREFSRVAVAALYEPRRRSHTAATSSMARRPKQIDAFHADPNRSKSARDAGGRVKQRKIDMSATEKKNSFVAERGKGGEAA